MGILNRRTRSDVGVGVLGPRVNRPGLKGEDQEAHDVQEGKQTENNPGGVVAGAYEDFAERDKDAQRKEQAQRVNDSHDRLLHLRREHENLPSRRVGAQRQGTVANHPETQNEMPYRHFNLEKDSPGPHSFSFDNFWLTGLAMM